MASPTANDDDYSTNEDTQLDGSVLDNDTDDDTPHSELTAQIATGPQHAQTFTFNIDGTFSYTPTAGFTGSDSFSYTVSDGSGSSSADVTITVNDLSNPGTVPPVATPDSYTTTENGVLTASVDGTPGGVLDNDTDDDTDHASLTASLVTGPAHGTLELRDDGSFVYTPSADYYGDDEFEYSVSDPEGNSSTTTAAIHVDANPVANPDYYYITEDQFLSDGAGSYGILGNDTDPDGTNPLQAGYAYGTSLYGGSYTVSTDGSFTYAPASGFVGNDSFQYTAIDSEGGSDVGTVSIQVRPDDYIEPVISAPLSYLAPHGSAKSVPFTVDTADTTHDENIHLSLYVGSGSLSIGNPSGVTVSGDGSNHTPLSLDGTEDAINEALQNLSFTAASPGENAYLEIYVDDALGGESYGVVQIRDQQSTDVVEGTANVDSSHAQNLDGDFHLFDDTDVDGDSPSGGDPHVTVLGQGNDAQDWYSFTVSADGTVIIDVDYAEALYAHQGDSGIDYAPTSFDAILTLYQLVNGALVEVPLSDSPGRDGSDGTDSGTASTQDPYVSIEASAGTYYLVVGQRDDSSDNQGDIPSGLTYQLNITAPHSVASNSPPVAEADSATIAERRTSVTVPQVATGSVLANDSDSNTSDTLSVIKVAGSTAKVGHTVTGDFGKLVVHSNGSYSYSVLNTDKLIKGETGTDIFHYTVSDGHGGTDSASLTFTIVGDDLDVFANGTFVAHRGDDRIKGGNHADTFAGRDGNDTLLGHGKNDSLFGEGGNDKLYGGSGDDRADGGAGMDRLSLGSGNDTGWGDGGNDTIFGGAGSDKLYGGDGDDTLNGGAGADRAQGRAGDDQLTLGAGDDKAWGGVGHDTVRGNGGDDQLAGGDDGDTLFGGSGNDRIWGDGGADSLAGGAGRDQLVGGAGNDRLFLDEGNDTAWGGAGDDQFVFTDGFGKDHVKDFHSGDTIVFAGPFSSYDDMKGHMSLSGDNVVIDAGSGNTVTIEHVKALHQGDFLFA